MRIHVISQIYLPEPAGVFTGDLVERWKGRGHQVTVWTGDYERTSLVARASTQVRFSVQTALALAAAGAAHSADIVVVVGGTPLPSALFALMPLAGARVVQWVYDLYPEALRSLRPHDPALRALGPPLERVLDLAWRRAHAVVAISAGMAERIRRRVPGANVWTIPLWAPNAVGPRSDRALALRRARKIPESAFVLMYHGNLGLAYDFEPLLQAARGLLDAPEFVFAIVGSGAQLGSIEARIAEHGLFNVRVFPQTTRDELPDSLAMGDCHFIGLRDGWSSIAFPSKFITAIAASRPIIAYARSDTELARLVRSNGCGSVISTGGGALVDAMKHLRQHPEVAREQAMAGRKLYEREFDRGAALARWDEVVGA